MSARGWNIRFCYQCRFPHDTLIIASFNMLSKAVSAWWQTLILLGMFLQNRLYLTLLISVVTGSDWYSWQTKFSHTFITSCGICKESPRLRRLWYLSWFPLRTSSPFSFSLPLKQLVLSQPVRAWYGRRRVHRSAPIFCPMLCKGMLSESIAWSQSWTKCWYQIDLRSGFPG